VILYPNPIGQVIKDPDSGLTGQVITDPDPDW